MSIPCPSAPTNAIPDAELLVESIHPIRRLREPVTAGIPLPRGAVTEVGALALRDQEGSPVPLQARCLDFWPDGSVRWALLDWQATAEASARYRLEVVTPQETRSHDVLVAVTKHGNGGIGIDTGRARFHLAVRGPFPFALVECDGRTATDGTRTGFFAEDERGRSYTAVPRSLEIIESGPLRAAVHCEADLVSKRGHRLCEIDLDLHFFAGSATVRFELTLRNPRRAEHPGNCWDLGDGGSVYLRDASLSLVLPSGEGDPMVLCSEDRESPYREFPTDLELYQDSSGGENWRCHNHMNRSRKVMNSFRGYRLRSAGRESRGLRATPAVALTRGRDQLAVAMRHFWENFPKSIEATGDGITLRLFPRQYADVHELQGGEQKTHVFWVAFGPDGVTEGPLDWCRFPLLARATSSWYCESGAIPYLTPRDERSEAAYLRLIDAAILGPDTFERKREVIDEYGWRHFGDVYGDHEAAFHQGPAPLVSHYNNQYDNVAGFAYQFLRSADGLWWQAMDELAAHVVDIDIYHTCIDRFAYNNGMFWHTFHYVDADTSTHRSYPRNQPVNGGGPSGGHVYATGLLIHHFLTGDRRSLAAVAKLAQFVIDMDDGAKSQLRWVDRGDYGHATFSGDKAGHGPGRAGANSLSALLEGHRLTGLPKFLAKAEQIIRRCIHPHDDVAARDLLDAEYKWFYTMFLQALGKYLDHKEEIGQIDFMYAYARASLLLYARWMAEYERPYLDRPEILEYPTETWAAQDMRKSEVFKFAAKYGSPEDRDRFLERSEFFFHYSTETLAGMPTRTLARPVVLLLSNGFMHAYFQKHPGTRSEVPPVIAAHDFGKPETFVPQKVRAIIKLKRLVAAAAIVVALLGVLAAAWAWS